MAGTKISNLPAATTPLAGTELVPVVQGGVTVKATAANINAAATYTSTGTGAVSRLVSSKLGDSVSVKDFGAVGDGVTDDTAAFVAAAAYAATVNRLILLTGETYIVTTLTLNIDAHFVGTGTIRKKPGTTGHLISSSANLKIDGNITLDQNAANCPNPSASFNTDCAINHTGSELVLIGVKSMPSVSSNINSNSTSLLQLDNCNVSGGWLCVRGVVNANCRVRICNGVYSGSTVYDNIAVENTQNYVIDGVTSHTSSRSCIVASNGAANGSIVNNICYGATVTGGQGGWGIVLSVNVKKTTVANNHCYNNETGGIDADVSFGGPDSIDSHNIIIGNTVENNDPNLNTRTGIYTNKSGKTVIANNTIKNFRQGILLNYSNGVTVTGNNIQNVGAGYFAQASSCVGVDFAGNTCVGIDATGTGTAALQFNNCSAYTAKSNSFDFGNVGTRTFIRNIGTCSNYEISSNTVTKSGIGSGYIFQLSTTDSNGRWSRNKISSTVAGWQWYMVGTGSTVTNVVTEQNEVIVSGIDFTRYALNAASVVGDGDTINGIRDKFSAAPTGWTFRNGYIAINNNIAQFWNGAAWVNI